MFLHLKATRKIWSVGLITKRWWFEVAAWSTARSVLKKCKLERRPTGWVLTTRWVGVAYCVDRRDV